MKIKVALVTGAAMGYKKGGPSIGGSIAIQLAKDGFKVVVVDVLKMREKTVEIIKKNGGEAISVRANVTKKKDILTALNIAKEKFGGLTCLVNCVARYSAGMANNVVKTSEDEWNKTLDVNLGGYYRCAKYAIPLILKSGGGTTINISSPKGIRVIRNFAVYAVSKAAIEALTKTLAIDFAPKIRTNCVSPDFVRIENSERGRSKEELENWYKEIARDYPMGRVCETQEVANVVSFLASDKASYINGETIYVDSGKTHSDRHNF
ncbi:MAG: SDR family oxidoreductase [Patescibacteria group bacterium]|nr:SDR family oxidoreductase [Patescibacteria group bacterium]